jgi:hypothetical protein
VCLGRCGLDPSPCEGLETLGVLEDLAIDRRAKLISDQCLMHARMLDRALAIASGDKRSHVRQCDASVQRIHRRELPPVRGGNRALAAGAGYRRQLFDGVASTISEL